MRLASVRCSVQKIAFLKQTAARPVRGIRYTSFLSPFALIRPLSRTNVCAEIPVHFLALRISMMYTKVGLEEQ